MRGIEQVRVRGLFQGGRGASAVAFVAFDDVCQHGGFGDIPPLGPVFRRAAAGTHFRGRGYVDLNLGVRADDGADIAAVEHGAWRLGGESALEGKQRSTHLGDSRDYRGRLAYFVGFERGLVDTRRIERLGGGNGGGLVVRAAAGIEHGLGHRAVDQPGVEMAKAVMCRELLAERTFARGRRPIDGDNHEKSAPSERISSTKPGKLVAMKAESSMRTGLSAASPIT